MRVSIARSCVSKRCPDWFFIILHRLMSSPALSSESLSGSGGWRGRVWWTDARVCLSQAEYVEEKACHCWTRSRFQRLLKPAYLPFLVWKPSKNCELFLGTHQSTRPEAKSFCSPCSHCLGEIAATLSSRTMNPCYSATTLISFSLTPSGKPVLYSKKPLINIVGDRSRLLL